MWNDWSTWDVIYIHSILYAIMGEFRFFSSTYGTLTKVDYSLIHKVYLNKSQKIKINVFWSLWIKCIKWMNETATTERGENVQMIGY